MGGQQGEFVSRDEVVQGLASLTAVPVTVAPLRKAVCKGCGLPVQWARTRDHQNIPMQPGQFPAWRVPADMRWSFTNDRLHHAPWLDGAEGCRLVHLDMCPARKEPEDPTMRLLYGRLWARATRLNGGIPVPVQTTEEESGS